jgi:hypothetical protein
MVVSFKMHYRNKLIDKKDYYPIPRPPSWDEIKIKINKNKPEKMKESNYQNKTNTNQNKVLFHTILDHY